MFEYSCNVKLIVPCTLLTVQRPFMDHPTRAYALLMDVICVRTVLFASGIIIPTHFESAGNNLLYLKFLFYSLNPATKFVVLSPKCPL
jgi:hypothetical protein